MAEFAVLASVWALFLAYVGWAPKETMQMTWLVLIALIIITSPVIILLWPQFR